MYRLKPLIIFFAIIGILNYIIGQLPSIIKEGEKVTKNPPKIAQYFTLFPADSSGHLQVNARENVFSR